MTEEKEREGNIAIIARMKLAVNANNDIDLARVLSIKSQGITRAKRQNIPENWIDKIVFISSYSKKWIKTGIGPMQMDHNIASTSVYPPEPNHKIAARIGTGRTTQQPKKKVNEQSEPQQAQNSCHDDFINKTTKIITSQTIYRSALERNIDAFYQAVETEEEMQGIKEEMRDLREDYKNRMDKLEKLILNMGGLTNEKRDSAANS